MGRMKDSVSKEEEEEEEEEEEGAVVRIKANGKE